MSAHVLVADDEALILQSLRGVLLQEGFEVTAASSGEQAWQTFVATRPDVVLLHGAEAQAMAEAILDPTARQTPSVHVGEG